MGIAGLLQDLQVRGLLAETLVIWGGEFGRTPSAEGQDGRDHHPYGFTMWLSGGGVRGGLAHVNVLGSMIFAGMSGSAVADAAGLGVIEIAAMKKEGYDAETAGAITAASATIGPIIPPSLPMIVYGVAAETSVGALFIAGVVPGLLMAAALMIMVRSLAIKQNMPRHPFEGFAALWRAFRRAFWAIVAPFLLIGGMFSGVFTPTEAAAVAVVYALVLGLFVYREFTWRDLPKLVIDTVETTGVVMALVMAATLLGYCLTVARIPQEFGGWLTALSTNPLVYTGQASDASTCPFR